MTAESSEESPRWAWFAHHQLAFIGVAIVCGIAGDLGITAVGFLGTVLMIGFLAGQIAVFKHTGVLCQRCLDAIPTNAPVLVKRRDWALRLQHWLVAHMLRVFAVFLAVLLLGAYFGVPTVTLVCWPWLAFDAWLGRFHRRVMPWCPYCPRGGDGDHAYSPDPVPTGTKEA